MNRRMVLKIIGRLLALEGVLMLLPAGVALYYGEACFSPLLFTALGAVVVGILMHFGIRGNDLPIFSREGFVIVALSWVLISLVGALPFTLSGEIPSYVDAFFETVSGFTTTGASILTNVEVMSRGLLFWRSFTHFLGGMGILVLMVALLPSNDRTIHILRAEMPGPSVEKFVPRAKNTAKILYLIYLVMTALEIVLLYAGGMPLFESTVHAFGTAGTGGFGIKADSIGSYSPYLQWVIAVFMALFGINFNLYFLILARRVRSALKSEELWVYIGFLLISTGIVTANLLPTGLSLADATRQSFFQVSSIVTTTGYATTNFDTWPTLSKAILLILMAVGGCAGSTAGGLKVSRVVLLFKTVRRELRRMLHPRSVEQIRLDGKNVDDTTLSNLHAYLAMYLFLLVATFFIISFDRFGFETNFSAALSCFNNVGPGLAGVGPASSYAGYSILSKLVLSAAMLFGRLEIVPLLITFSPSTWTKK